MKTCALNYINNEIKRQASNLRFTVAQNAPSNEIDLFNSTSLVIWLGASDNTIFDDANINYIFRALHDNEHLKTGLGFSPQNEIALGLIQASKQTSDLMRELFYTEIVGQAEYYLKNGIFVTDQKAFGLSHLKAKGVL